MKQAVGSVALGAACFGIAAALVNSEAGEGEIWAAWLSTTAVAACLAGYCWPEQPMRGVLFIMLTQPPCLLVATVLAGDIPKGLVDVAIASTLVLLWSPAPLLLGWLGARARRRGLRAAKSS